MKSIPTLLRVKQMEIDGLKRQQGVFENQREILIKTGELLANSLTMELKAAQTMPDMAQFYGNFSANIKKRQEIVAGHIRNLDRQLDVLAQQIRDVFGEMKKFELALTAHQKREMVKITRRTQQEMDEIAIRGYGKRHEE